MAEGNNSEATSTSENTPQVIYRCRKCRQIVASEENVVSHSQGEGETSFMRRKRNPDSQPSTQCTSLFVNPMKWMQPVEEGYVSDKLYCIGYKNRLGSFNWVEMQCSCGAWVRPAFQLLKSKIDECKL